MVKKTIESCYLVLLMFLSGGCCAAEFTADMVQHEPPRLVQLHPTDKPRMVAMEYRNKIYVRNSDERVEVFGSDVDARGQVKHTRDYIRVLIYLPRKGLSWCILPAHKTYAEGVIPATSNRDMWLASKARMKRVGSERLSGYACDRYKEVKTVNGAEQKIELWWSRDLDYPMKVLQKTPIGTNYWELRNINRQPLSDALFSVPVGYKRMKPTGWHGKPNVVKPQKR